MSHSPNQERDATSCRQSSPTPDTTCRRLPARSSASEPPSLPPLMCDMYMCRSAGHGHRLGLPLRPPQAGGRYLSGERRDIPAAAAGCAGVLGACAPAPRLLTLALLRARSARTAYGAGLTGWRPERGITRYVLEQVLDGVVSSGRGLGMSIEQCSH